MYNQSRKNSIISSFLANRISSYGVMSLTEEGMGPIWWSLSVAPVVVSSANQSHVCVTIVFLLKDAMEIQLNSSPNAVSSNWFSRAHAMGDE
jgi:hypothetical protein